MVSFDAVNIASDYRIMKVKLICVLHLFSISLLLYKISIFHLKITEEGEGGDTDADEIETHFKNELIESVCLIFTIAFFLQTENITQHLN